MTNELAKGLEGALAACPFCGRAASSDNAVQEAAVNIHTFPSPAGGYAYRVQCVCGVLGPSHRHYPSARETWNRRTSPPPARLEREAVERMMTEMMTLHVPLSQRVRRATDAILALSAGQAAWKPWSAATDGMRRAAAERSEAHGQAYGVDFGGGWDAADDICDAFLTAAPPTQPPPAGVVEGG